MTPPLAMDATLKRADDLLATELDGEVVLMSIEKGTYYGVADTAQRIWVLLEEPQTVSALCEKLCAEYHIDSETCQRDVLPFLQQLLEEGLLFVV